MGKQYGARVQNMSKDALLKPTWNELPLACLQDIYQPFTKEVQVAMSKGPLEEFCTAELISLLLEVEQYGPVHICGYDEMVLSKTDSLFDQMKASSCNEPLSAYIDPAMTNEHICRLLLGTPLKVAALMEDADDHADWALPTFIHWVKTNKWFHHQKSGTWHGGLLGVHWIIAVYVHFSSAFTIYERFPSQLPTNHIEAFDACNYCRLKATLVMFASWLMESFKETIKILKQTYTERAHAWKDAVVAAHLTNADSSCYDWLQNQDLDNTLETNSVPVQNLQRRVLKQVEVSMELDQYEFSESDSTSAEEIELPSSDDDDSSSSQNDPGCDSTLGDSEIELGQYNSRTMRESSRTKSIAESEGKDNTQSSDRASQTTPPPGTVTEQFDYEDILADPSWGQTTSFGDADDESEELPSRILADILLRKEHAVGTPGRPRTHMIMEVILETPRRRSLQKSDGNTHLPEGS
ncbi:hypothetical protein FRC11_010566, partial [Ceratobasidium sp. 423]